ncbi:MAG TPA: hypothetical protein VHQ47_21160 [Phycisphaerae bacterium]|nr:hypothetical protein [Phycisphaerae bacterium]
MGVKVAVMRALTVREFAGNPFGVLGLGPGATQAEVDGAARRMRVMAGQGVVAKGEKGARSGMAVERAVAQLADPIERVRARVWWIGGGKGKREELVREVIALASNMDRAAKRSGRWGELLARAEIMARDATVLAELQRQERAGEFEKAATPAEVAGALAEVPTRLAEMFARVAWERMLDHDDPRLAMRMAQMLPQFASGRTVHRQLLTRIEDYLTRGFDRWKETIRQAWNTRTISRIRPACDLAMELYRKKFSPTMEALERGGGVEDQMYRVRAAAAGYLDYVSQAYEAIYQYGTSRRIAGRAIAAARGTARQSELEQRWQRLKRERWKLVRPRARKRSWRGFGAAVGVAIAARTVALFFAPATHEQTTPAPAISAPTHVQMSPEAQRLYQHWLDTGTGRPMTAPER